MSNAGYWIQADGMESLLTCLCRKMKVEEKRGKMGKRTKGRGGRWSGLDRGSDAEYL